MNSRVSGQCLYTKYNSNDIVSLAAIRDEKQNRYISISVMSYIYNHCHLVRSSLGFIDLRKVILNEVNIAIDLIKCKVIRIESLI